MQLTIKELTYISQIIRVTKLVGVPTFKRLTAQDKKEVFQSLQEKGIIKEHTLSEKGKAVSTSLELYSTATQYLKFGDTVFAQYEDKEYIMLGKKEEIYHLELIEQDYITIALLSKFKDMDKIEEKRFRKKKVSTEEFQRKIEFFEENGLFYYKVNTESNDVDSGVLYIEDGYLQKYSASKEELEMYPKSRVQRGIEKLFI